MKRVVLFTFVLLSVFAAAQGQTRGKKRDKAQTQIQTQPQATQPKAETLAVAPQSETPKAEQKQENAQPQAKSEAPAQAQAEQYKAPAEAVKPAETAKPATAPAKPKEQPAAKPAEQTKEAPKYTNHTPKVNAAAVDKNAPVKPVKPFCADKVIDTLATANKNLAVILLNDNTWRYVQIGTIEADKTIFSKYWSTEYTFPYYNVPLSSLPESIPIKLVDSLRAYHYPYKGYVTSRFGPRNGRRHNGMDISLKTGDTIRAVFNGKVRFSKFHENGYGELIVIRHDNGLETYYAHLSKRMVKAGERVAAGQTIGLGGSTGRSSGPHLHFEMRYMGQAFDPERIIDFKTGNLRRDFILLKRFYFDINSKYAQDFNSEVEPEPKPATTTTTTTAKPATTATKPATTTKPTTTSSTSTKPKTTTTTTSKTSTSTSTAKPKTSTSTSAKSSTSTTTKPKTTTPEYYVVESGDCLGGLAVRFKTTLKELCRLNNIKEEDQDKIKIGQKLRIR